MPLASDSNKVDASKKDECDCDNLVYGDQGGSTDSTPVWVAVGIGAILLLVVFVAMFAYLFRGQQTGTQLTSVGEAQANQYKDMNLPENLKVLNMPGSSGLNVTGAKV